MNILVYDIEIKKAILSRNEIPQKDIEYAAGWDDPALGVSCLAAALWCPERWEVPVYSIFMEDNLPLFHELITSADLLVGFNTVKFDNKHLNIAGIVGLDQKPHFDMLREMWIASSLDPDNFNPKTHGGFSLRQTLETNLPKLAEKQDNGAWAPVLYQRKKFGELVNYCVKNVRLELELFRHIRANKGRMISPKTKQEIQLNLPWENK